MPNRHVVNEIIAAYANAAVEGAQALGGRDAVVEVRNQMVQVLGFMATNIKLRLTLDDESLGSEQRKELAHKVFADYNPVFVELLGVMASRADMHRLRRVAEEYEALVETKLNFTIVDVTTVVELDDDLRTLITNKLSADLGNDVYLVEHIDESIMGGIIMRAGGRYIDSSVRSQLLNARNVLNDITTDGGEC